MTRSAGSAGLGASASGLHPNQTWCNRIKPPPCSVLERNAEPGRNAEALLFASRHPAEPGRTVLGLFWWGSPRTPPHAARCFRYREFGSLGECGERPVAGIAPTLTPLRPRRLRRGLPTRPALGAQRARQRGPDFRTCARACATIGTVATGGPLPSSAAPPAGGRKDGWGGGFAFSEAFR